MRELAGYDCDHQYVVCGFPVICIEVNRSCFGDECDLTIWTVHYPSQVQTRFCQVGISLYTNKHGKKL